MTRPIVLIDATTGLQPVHDLPREDRRISGAPQRQTWTLHQAGPMSAGIWACEVGRWRIVFPAGRQEYFHVLQGRVRLHGPDGAVDIGPGQGGVIRRGSRASSRSWSRYASTSCWWNWLGEAASWEPQSRRPVGLTCFRFAGARTQAGRHGKPL